MMIRPPTTSGVERPRKRTSGRRRAATYRMGGIVILVSTMLLSGAAVAATVEELPPHIVAVEGGELPALRGAAIDCLRATAVADDGAARAVPVQVDERFERDGALEWAFEAGAEPRRDPQAGFDADDLLLLDVRDAGACGATRAGTVGIEIDGAGCLLVGCNAAEPPVPPRVRALDRNGAIAGDGYRLGFAPGGAAWLNELRLGGEGADNVLDRSKARLRLELPLGLVVQRDEGDVRTRVTGEHAGPLRVVREIEVRGRVALNVYSPPMRDRFVFYADGFSIPTSVVISPSAALLLRSISLRLSMDLRPGAALEFRSAPDLTAALAITGQEGRRGHGSPLDWYLLRASDVGLLGWLETDAAYRAGVTLYYDDDDAHLDPPEDVAGERGDHGFLFVRDGDLVTGGFRLVTQAWIVRGPALDNPETTRRAFTTRPSYRVH